MIREENKYKYIAKELYRENIYIVGFLAIIMKKLTLKVNFFLKVTMNIITSFVYASIISKELQ